MKIGVQGYTIREFCKDEKSIAESVKKISKLGFTTLQMSGFGEIDPKTMRSICDENNISVIITHTNPDRILNDTEAVMKEHEIMGCPHIGIGVMPKPYRWSYDGAMRFIEDYDVAAGIFASNGFKLHYHNHYDEFRKASVDGKTILEAMADATDPNKWGFILDTYWSQYGGICPAEMMRRLKGRIDVCHFKDMVLEANEEGKTEHRFAAVGSGNLPWKEILAACKETNIEYAMIEQDTCYGGDPFDKLRSSHDYLAKFDLTF